MTCCHKIRGETCQKRRDQTRIRDRPGPAYAGRQRSDSPLDQQLHGNPREAAGGEEGTWVRLITQSPIFKTIKASNSRIEIQGSKHPKLNNQSSKVNTQGPKLKGQNSKDSRLHEKNIDTAIAIAVLAIKVIKYMPRDRSSGRVTASSGFKLYDV